MDGIAKGTRSVIAESVLLKHQLLILNRSRRRAPNLRFSDRLATGRQSQLEFEFAMHTDSQNWNRIPTSISRGSPAFVDFPKFGEVTTPEGAA